MVVVAAHTLMSVGGGDSEVQRTMLELLNQLDGFEATKNIKVRPCLSAALDSLLLVISSMHPFCYTVSNGRC